MAKRVVVFDTDETSLVKVRKANKNVTKQVVSSSVPAPANPPASKKSKPSKPQKILPDYNVFFHDKLLVDMRRALNHAQQLMANENDPDKEYYARKSAFLENAIRSLNSEECSFTFLSEPFFWNEFKRIATVIAEGPKGDGNVSSIWRKTGNKCAAILLKNLNALRAERDGWIVNTAPVIVRDLVFFINGTMFHLDLQMNENPERDDLRQLRQMYAKVYAKSGLKKEGAKLAYLIRKKDLRRIWKNQETVGYLLEAHPERKNA